MADRLTIALSTIGGRLDGLGPARLPPGEGCDWLILVQGDGDVAAARARFAARADVTITALPSRGAAASRNAALAMAGGDIVLFADDDMGFDAAGHQRLRRAMAGQDVLTLRLDLPEGGPRKGYPADGQRLRRWSVARFGTPEIAVRVQAFRACGVQFDTGFGAGAPCPVGDEFIFLCDALRAGLAVRHAAITVGTHPADSSGTRDTPALWDARRQVFARALGPWAGFWRLAFAVRRLRRFGGLGPFWRFVRPG
jgi:hypothetical protein